MASLTALSSFMAGYLHQDWDVEYADPLTAAREFGRSEAVELVLGELAMLNAATIDDATIEGILRGVGCYYRPVDTSLKTWLIALEQEIGSAVWHRYS